jgi:hypothetical protein
VDERMGFGIPLKQRSESKFRPLTCSMLVGTDLVVPLLAALRSFPLVAERLAVVKTLRSMFEGRLGWSCVGRNVQFLIFGS